MDVPRQELRPGVREGLGGNTVATEVTDPLVHSSARIIRRAATDLVCSDEDWPIAAAQVVLSQPVVRSALVVAAEHQLVKARVLELHQLRVWGIQEPDIFGKPIPPIKQCRECHKSHPCPTVQAYGVTE